MSNKTNDQCWEVTNAVNMHWRDTELDGQDPNLEPCFPDLTVCPLPIIYTLLKTGTALVPVVCTISKIRPAIGQKLVCA